MIDDLEVVCTWGDGPDVMVCGKRPILNLQDVGDLDRFKHGTSRDWQLDLTADEALKLASELTTQAFYVKMLEEEIEDMENK